MARRAHPGRTEISFATFARSWLYLRRTGDLPRRRILVDHGVPLWYVLENRPGFFAETDRALAERGRAAYPVTRLGVPLVWIFPFAERERLTPA